MLQLTPHPTPHQTPRPVVRGVVPDLAHQPLPVPPSLAVVLAAGAVAVVLVLLLWSVVGHVVTFAHEGGHALAAVLMGSRVHGVRLNRDRTGLTEYSAPLFGLPVTAAGYVAPSGFGVAGAALLARGRGEVVLWVSVALLAVLLLATRNWFGRLAVAVTGAALVLTLQRGTPDEHVLVACVWVWLLLVGGLVHVLRHGAKGSDFHALRRATWIVPATVWAALATTAAAVALVYGGMLLLGAAAPPG